jgi:dihydroorotase-like cyclic amidohydrolase
VVRPGSDADVVLYDPEPESILTDASIHMRAGYTPFRGMRVQGEVVATIRRGSFLVRDGTLVDPGDTGIFLGRSTDGALRR